jgi:hypothetical protein
MNFIMVVIKPLDSLCPDFIPIVTVTIVTKKTEPPANEAGDASMGYRKD